MPDKPNFLKKVTWVHTVAAMLGAVLSVAIAWNTLGWDTVAMSSEVQAVEAIAIEQTEEALLMAQGAYEYAQSNHLSRLYDRLANMSDALWKVETYIRDNPNDQMAQERASDLRRAIRQLEDEIRRAGGSVY